MKEIEATPSKSDWARVDAMSDEELLANALSDPDTNPMTEENKHLFVPVARSKTLRRVLGLTLEEFSARYHIPLGTLRDWEQHRSEPDQASKAYLKVIAADPEHAARALAD